MQFIFNINKGMSRVDKRYPLLNSFLVRVTHSVFDVFPVNCNTLGVIPKQRRFKEMIFMDVVTIL